MAATVSTLDDALVRWRTNLGLLSPSRAQMDQDLEDNADQVASHPFIRALAGEAAESPGPLPEEEELDALQDPANSYTVLDADGSQRICLEAARRGQSFSLLGGPRSGKKQTIVNLVANALVQGKKILVVGGKPSVLETIARRLADVGLGDFCLEVRGSRAEVTALLDGRMGKRPTHASNLSPVDFQKLTDCRARLTAYIHALHAIRAPLERSAWSMLGELLKWSGVSSVPLGLAFSRTGTEAAEQVVVTEVSASWLEEARQAVQRMQQLWHIRAETDFPWKGFKADRYTKQLRDDVTALVERVRGRLERLLTVAEHYAAQVGCEGSVARLVKVGELLETAPANISADWLKSGNLDELSKDLEHCAGEYQRLGSARTPLTERYGPSIWQLPEGTAANVDQAWRAAAPLMPARDDRGVSLLSHQQQLRGWAADTQRRIPGWITEARTLEKWLAIALPRGAGADADPNKADPGALHLRQLQRLANLCMSDNPPERTWVHNAQVLEEARALIAANKPAFADFHRRRQELLEVYRESFFELELERMAQGFAGPYRSWLRIFNRQFRRDRRALRRRSLAETVPETMAQDVQTGSEVLAEKTRLEAEQPKRQNVLGRYEKGLETDFEAAEKGTRIAGEAVELVHKLGFTSLPQRFVDVLCGGSAPPEKVRAAAKRLHDSLGAWQHETQALKNHLPLEHFPGTGRSLEESALSQLNQYARKLQTALNHFGSLTDQVLARAVTKPSDAVTLVADLHQAEEVRAFEASNETDAERWKSRLGAGFQGLATDWTNLTKALHWTKRVQGFFQGPPPARFIQAACAGPGKAPSFRDMRAASEQYEQALHSLEIRFDPPGPLFQDKRLGEHLPEVVKQRLAVMRDRAGELADWVECRQLPIRFAHLGLSAFWEALVGCVAGPKQHATSDMGNFGTGNAPYDKPPTPDQIPGVFMRSFLSTWLDAIFKQDQALAAFRREDHDQLLAEFCDLDRRWQEQNPQRIIQEIDKARPREPICLLANPVAVSTSLPENMRFDVVLFAEASQVLTEDALAAIYRGRQIIVGGDDRQPGPGQGSEANNESTPFLPESLLDACLRAGLPRLNLRGNYAGQHESLMTFANLHFYRNHLNLVSSPFKEHPDLGTKFHHVADGIMDKGQNSREAASVADLVGEHFKTAPEKSLGVITFDADQREAIAGQISKLQIADGKLQIEEPLSSNLQSPISNLQSEKGPESFYVMDARNVTGEDRDVIILSIGYGKDKSGVLPLEPLDQEEGPRLVNAAITRARQKLIVVSSIKASDIDPAVNTAEGLVLLRQFLDFAETGRLGKEAGMSEAGPLELDIIQELQTRGFTAQAQIGDGNVRPDLAVVDPKDSSRYVLGIELDGPAAFTVSTARERDRLRHEELQRMGWNLHHIWAPAWIFHRQEEIEKLVQAIGKGTQP